MIGPVDGRRPYSPPKVSRSTRGRAHVVNRLRGDNMRAALVSLTLAVAACASTGGEVKPSDADSTAMRAVGGRANASIVWSSGRVGNHKLFTMKSGGSDVRQITRGDNVDWFPRFSPDGTKILFT